MQSTSSPETKPSSNRELLLFAPIYMFLSLLNLRIRLLFAKVWFDGTLAQDHDLLLRFRNYNNDQSRLLQFYIPEFFHRAFGWNIEDAYAFQRWLFIALALILFHKYLRHWFSRGASFGGVVFFAAIMPWTYFNDLQESAPLLLVTFVLGLIAIRDNNTPLLLATLFVGGLNNETMLALPLVYMFYHFDSWQPRALARLVGKTLLISLPLLVTLGPIRFINRDRPYLVPVWQLPENIRGIATDLKNISTDWFGIYDALYLFILFLFSAFWVYAFLGFKSKPLFLRRASIIVPLLVIASFLIGIIYEVRLVLPLGFIIIPLALFTVAPPDADDAR